MHDDSRILTIILKNLDTVSDGLSELQKYSTSEINTLKVRVSDIVSDIKTIKGLPCPKSPNKIKEIIEVERLQRLKSLKETIKEVIEGENFKWMAGAPKRRKAVVLYVFAILGIIATLITVGYLITK